MTADEALQHLNLLAQAADSAPLNGQSHRNVAASIQALAEYIKPKEVLKP